jgi:hypothetical protein
MRIRVRSENTPSTQFVFSGDQKWVAQGGNLDVYSKGVLGRDSLIHDHGGARGALGRTRSFQVDRSALRSRSAVRLWAISREAEISRLHAGGTKLSILARFHNPNVERLSNTVTALEAQNLSLWIQLSAVRDKASGRKWSEAQSALRQSNSATRTARLMTDRATAFERVAREAGAKAARMNAEVLAKSARIQAEAAVKSANVAAEVAAKTARKTAEAAAKTGRAAAEAAAKTSRLTLEASLKTLRLAAEAAAKTARVAAEAAVTAARMAAEATARAAAATAKAVGAVAAATISAMLGG